MRPYVPALLASVGVIVVMVASRTALLRSSAAPVGLRAIRRVDDLASTKTPVVGPPWEALVDTIRQALRLRAAIASDVPALAEAMARELRAGAGVRQAIVDGLAQVGGPLGRDRAWLERRLEVGAELDDTLQLWARRRRSRELGQLAAVVSLGNGLGGSFAPALDGLAQSALDRLSAAGEAKAQAAQARSSALFLILAPVAFTAVMAAVDPRHLDFLIGTAAGWACLIGAVALDGLGAWWMWRLTERVK